MEGQPHDVVGSPHASDEIQVNTGLSQEGNASPEEQSGTFRR